MKRSATVGRQTKETDISITLDLDGSGTHDISTGIPFFDHMLILFSVHGFFDLTVKATGDLEVDFHHTVEDVGIVLGQALSQALGERQGIKRYGYAVTPMDESLARVAVDLSNRPFLVFNVPAVSAPETGFGVSLVKEFLRSLSINGGFNLHVNVDYGESEHHIIEAVFKAVARAIDMGATIDDRISGPLSSKGAL